MLKMRSFFYVNILLLFSSLVFSMSFNHYKVLSFITWELLLIFIWMFLFVLLYFFVDMSKELPVTGRIRIFFTLCAVLGLVLSTIIIREAYQRNDQVYFETLYLIAMSSLLATILAKALIGANRSRV